MKFILASSSPRRRELLENAGFHFEVRPSRVRETPRKGEAPEEFARRAAREKALAVAACARGKSLVLGADTVVAVRNLILGKPSNSAEAFRILNLLSNSTHHVITGVCLVRPPDRVEALEHETTHVTFHDLGRKEIRDYIQSGEPFDKAGAYGIQGLASKFVKRIEGCYFNVVGLPVPLVYQMLKPWLRRRR